MWEILTKAVDSGNIPHALLFSGRGEDKKAFAIKLAKYINCLSAKKPCSSCENCRKEINPDFFLIEPEGKEIQISQIRELIWKLSLTSYSESFKVAVICKAEAMNIEAQNSLLKILEEPKGKTLIMLITDYPDTLLPTILSRVQRIRFYNKEKEEEVLPDLAKLLTSNLAFKFKFAKDMAEKENNEIARILENWSYSLRTAMINKAKGKEALKGYSPLRISKIISLIQSTLYLLSTTNINTKLALETMFLEI